MAELPIIVLAFANDQEGNRYLRNLREELRQLQAILEAAEEKGLCKLVVRPDAILDEIFEAFTEHRDRVAIFHYGGHAGGDRLFLESTGTEGAVAHAEGLATFLGQRRNLQLVFLNGCSTRAQAAGLLDAGVAAVIATARAIEDAIALSSQPPSIPSSPRGSPCAPPTRRPEAGSRLVGARRLRPISGPGIWARPTMCPWTPPTTAASPGSCVWPPAPSWTGAGACPRRSATRCSACPRRTSTGCPRFPTVVSSGSPATRQPCSSAGAGPSASFTTLSLIPAPGR